MTEENSYLWTIQYATITNVEVIAKTFSEAISKTMPHISWKLGKNIELISVKRGEK